MKFPFQLGRREYMMEPLGSEHAGAMAALHQDAFARPWSETEFAALIGQDTVFGFLAVEIGRMKGGAADLQRLQELWVEMLARSEEMLPGDRAPLARAIVLKQDEIYKATDLPRQSPVWPPEPNTGQATR